MLYKKVLVLWGENTAALADVAARTYREAKYVGGAMIEKVAEPVADPTQDPDYDERVSKLLAGEEPEVPPATDTTR